MFEDLFKAFIAVMDKDSAKGQELFKQVSAGCRGNANASSEEIKEKLTPRQKPRTRLRQIR